MGRVPPAWGHEARPRHERGGSRGHPARGLHLPWTSLKVLSKNPNLLVLPLLALVLNGFVWLLVALSVWVLGFPPRSPSSDVVYWELFIAYQVTYFLATYFMAAIVAATSARFEGRAPTVADGVGAARSPASSARAGPSRRRSSSPRPSRRTSAPSARSGAARPSSRSGGDPSPVASWAPGPCSRSSPSAGLPSSSGAS